MTKYKFSRYNWFEFDLPLTDGEHPSNPDAWSRWHVDKWGKIKFLNQDDFVLFTLRWG